MTQQQSFAVISNSKKTTSATSFLLEYPTSGILSKVLLEDNNCQYSLFCLAAGTEIEEHTFTRNAVITAIEGQGKLKLEGKDITLAPGILVFIPKNVPHAVRAEENLAFILTLSELLPIVTLPLTFCPNSIPL